MSGVIMPLPPVESLWADVEVPAGEASIVLASLIMVEPLESLVSLTA